MIAQESPMSVQQSDTVDFIGVDKSTGDVTLAIADDLDWSDEESHLEMLQNKINTYLRFIESGEISQSYPQAAGKRIVMEVVGKYDLCDSAQEFIRKAASIVEASGFILRFRKL
jgi:hypothetical protein